LGTQDSDIEGPLAVELEAGLGKAKAPAFQPHLQLSVLFVAFRNDDQVNIVSPARIPQFSAAEPRTLPGRCRLRSVPRIVAARASTPPGIASRSNGGEGRNDCAKTPQFQGSCDSQHFTMLRGWSGSYERFAFAVIASLLLHSARLHPRMPPRICPEVPLEESSQCDGRSCRPSLPGRLFPQRQELEGIANMVICEFMGTIFLVSVSEPAAVV
jgi:hypothetical protein